MPHEHLPEVRFQALERGQCSQRREIVDQVGHPQRGLARVERVDAPAREAAGSAQRPVQHLLGVGQGLARCHPR